MLDILTTRVETIERCRYRLEYVARTLRAEDRKARDRPRLYSVGRAPRPIRNISFRFFLHNRVILPQSRSIVIAELKIIPTQAEIFVSWIETRISDFNPGAFLDSL